jgi:thiol-disulfide isomerase/thioredoxin
VVSGGAKALVFQGSRDAAAAFGAPWRLAPVVAVALPTGEIGIAALLLLEPTGRWGALAALLLLAIFIVAIARLMRAGESPDCHCFGQLDSEPVGAPTLIRNGVLAALAVTVLAGGAGKSLTALPGHSVALLALSVALAGLLVFSSSLLLENRRLVASGGTPNPGNAGVAVGTPAPDLQLRTLDGKALALRERLAGGRPAVLVHVSPSCGPCRALLPKLVTWTAQLDGILEIVTISSGEVDRNRELLNGYDGHEILLAADRAFAAAYRANATPAAIGIGPGGRVTNRPVTGAVAIEELIRASLNRAAGEQNAPVLSVIPAS